MRERRVDEIVARVSAIFAFYRCESGDFEHQSQLFNELRDAVAGLDSSKRTGKRVHTRFFQELEGELIARHGKVPGRELISTVREACSDDKLTVVAP